MGGGLGEEGGNNLQLLTANSPAASESYGWRLCHVKQSRLCDDKTVAGRRATGS